MRADVGPRTLFALLIATDDDRTGFRAAGLVVSASKQGPAVVVASETKVRQRRESRVIKDYLFWVARSVM